MKKSQTNPREKALLQQALAADPTASAIVSANAGSGKTHVLINRVTRILLAGTAPEQVLCVTYTKAAASEMLNRLFEHLGKFSILPNAELSLELKKLDPQLSPGPEDLAKARRLFARALETPGGLKIRTIHGFCETLLRQFPVEAGISAGFTIIEETKARELQQKLIKQVHLTAVNNPNSDLAAAYQLLTQAGSTMVPQVFDTASQNARALQSDFANNGGLSGVLANSAKQLGVQIDDTEQKICRTAMKSFDDQDLRIIAAGLANGAKKNQQKSQDILGLLPLSDPIEKFNALVGVFLLKSMKRPNKFVSNDASKAMPELPELCLQVVEKLEAILPKIYAVQTFTMTNAALRLCYEFVEKFAAAKQEAGYVDFDDLIEYTKSLLTSTLSTEWVLYKLDGNLTHVLVDEAQDNSPAQWAVIGALTDEFFAGAGARDATRTMFAVGDPKQSIYRFQGADPSLFVEQKELLQKRKSAGFEKINAPQLSLSWRSTPQVLEFVDACFSGLSRETKFVGDPQDYTKTNDPGFSDYLEHGAERINSVGSVTLFSPVTFQNTNLDTNPSKPVDAVSAKQSVSILAKNVASNIKSLLDEDKQISGGDILVLVRSRNPLFHEIIRHLKMQSVPVAGADQMILQSETAVLDLLSIAKASLQPADDLSLAEILTGPFLHPQKNELAPITSEILFELANKRGAGQTLHNALMQSKIPALSEAKKWLTELIERAAFETPYRFFSGLLYRLSDTGEPFINRLFARLGAEAADPVQEFLSLALSFSQTGDGSLLSFVTQMSSREDKIKRELQAADEKVRVMTIHGAKGLEAPIVFLPDTNNTPGGRAIAGLARTQDSWIWVNTGENVCAAVKKFKQKQETLDIQEHRRLLYVALTRARDHLVICAHEKNKVGGIGEDSWYQQCETAFGHLVLANKATKTEIDAGEFCYELGSSKKVIAPKQNTSPTLIPKSPKWLFEPWQEEQQPTTITPSAAQAKPDDLVSAISPIGPDNAKRFLRGNLIHSLLQTLPDLDKSNHLNAAKKFLDQHLQLTQKQKQEIIDVTLQVLNYPDFGHLFGANSRAELPISGTISGPTGKQVINGKIDRLVVRSEEVLVLDFKTNRPPPKTLADVPTPYLQQMATYRALLQQVWPDKIIRCALLWTDGPNLMEIPDNLLY